MNLYFSQFIYLIFILSEPTNFFKSQKDILLHFSVSTTVLKHPAARLVFTTVETYKRQQYAIYITENSLPMR